MKFTSAIIALSVVAALAQAAGPLDSVLAPLSGVTNGVTNGVAQKRDLPGGLTDAAGGAAQNLPLAGTIMNLVSGATSEATAPNGVNVVKRDGLSDLLALANGLADTTGTGAKALQKRDAKINIDAKLKAAVELCLHAITDVKVKAELVAQILAKVKAELKIDIDAELEAKLLGKLFKANSRTSDCAFLVFHCSLHILDAFSNPVFNHPVSLQTEISCNQGFR